VKEVLDNEASRPCFQALNALFFIPLHGLRGILDISLQDLRGWANLSSMQTAALTQILDMIRLRAQVDSQILARTQGRSPPKDNDERAWRRWMRLAAPRAIADVLQFLELHSGYPCPPEGSEAFAAGFRESLHAALRFKQQHELHTDGDWSQSENLYVNFVLRMVDQLQCFAPSTSMDSSEVDVYNINLTNNSVPFR
jgi:hypothetical protein